ncbi:tetratricopeptide repeat protein [Hymenobacter negativus]|uniref:histidine kinase n=1 Tax=Hymenobacter negativus TaxID=2795026 RepID=A0ABS3QJZ5_9BACT|nr:tetratricopeptide repeat protein [Hymenobacter negativus]MBO2011585.1 histidine kinase [Hymenobacter negativus]
MIKSFLLLLLACSIGASSWAEALHPAPSKAVVDSLKTKLRHSAPNSTERLEVLLDLSSALIARNEQLDTELDSAYYYSKQAEALSTALQVASGKIRSLQALGRLGIISKQEKDARSLLQESIRLSRQLGDKQLEAQGLNYLGNTYSPIAANLPLIITYFQQARTLYQQLGDKLEEAYLLESIAGQHILQGSPAQAIPELAQAIALYRSVGYKRLHYCYDLLLYAHRQAGDYRAALQYGLAALESAKATRDTADITLFYSRVSGIYKELNQLDKALLYNQKAFTSAMQPGREAYIMPIAGHISEILLLQHKPQPSLDILLRVVNNKAYRSKVTDQGQLLYYLARSYTALHLYAEAERCYTDMLRALKPSVKEVDRLLVYYNVGAFYWLTKKYPEARDYLTKSLDLATKVGTLPQVANIHLLLFKVDSVQANFPAAIAHYQQYKALNDSVFSTTKSKQIASLQIQYDTKKKEQNIALLTKQTQVQQAGLRQREWQRNATLGGAVLLLLLLGVSYNRSRLKRRSTQLLEQKQQEINQKNQSLEQVLGDKNDLLAEKEGLLVEKEWMLKEIHHRVKNNLQIVSELLDSQLDRLQEPQMQAIIRESQNRVQAMALVHQKLYQAQNLARVDMQEFIRELVEHLLTSFHHASVQEHLDIAPVELDVALATPLGLIINEAVTNSLKYAFPDSRLGTISIRLTQLPDQRYQLMLADDGIGLPAGFNLAASRSMGLTLIMGLSEQLEADLTFPQTQGVCICLEFEGTRKVPHAEA